MAYRASLMPKQGKTLQSKAGRGYFEFWRVFQVRLQEYDLYTLFFMQEGNFLYLLRGEVGYENNTAITV